VFADEHDFPYSLLCDVDRTVGRAYGIERPADDPYPDYPRRVTFLIDPGGTVEKVYEVTDAGAHPGEVLADLQALTST
jgi:peroxiredoxin Q/BCP